MMEDFMKKLAGVLVLFALVFVGCKKADKKAAASDVTGKVVIYTSMYEDVIDAVSQKLKAQFPHLEAEFFYGGTGKIQAKIAAEKDSGKLGCDMMMVAEPAYSLELKENGMLHNYMSPEAASLSFEYDKEGAWYPVRICTMVLAYNPEKYSTSDIPTTLKDFATDPRLTGYSSMSNPLTSGTAMASIVGLLDAYGEDYFVGLGKQRVAIESGSVALTKLETGECKEIMILEESVLKKRQEEGSKLAVIYPEDGVLCIPSTVMTVNEKWCANNNIKACEAVTDWLLGKDGQQCMVDGWMHSVRGDVDYVPYDSIPNKEAYAKTIPIDSEKCYKEGDSIRTAFEEHVTIKKK